MPRVQLVQPVEPGGVVRQPRIDAAGMGALVAAPGRAIAGVGEAATKALIAYDRAQQELTEMDTRLDISTKASQFAQDVAAEDIRLQQQGLEPDAYAEALARKVQEIRQTHEQRLAYPDSAPRYRIATEAATRKAIVDARYRALDIKNARVQTRTAEALTDLARQRVHGTPEERDAAVARAGALIDELVTRRIWSGEQGVAARKTWERDVTVGEIERDFFVPERRAEVVGRLMTGGYDGLPVSEQMTLGRQLIERHEVERRALQAEAKQRWETDKASALRQTIQEAEDKTVTVQQARERAALWQWTDTEYKRVIAELERDPEAAEPASDPTTRQWMLRNVYVARPTVTEAQIHARRDRYIATGGAEGLNAKDYKDALATLQSRTQTAQSDTMAEMAQAEQRLKAALGIPDIIPENLDPVRSRLFDQALEQLTVLAFPRGGQARAAESPLAVVERMIPQLRAQLGEAARLQANEARALLRYPTPQALEQAYADRPKDALYRQQRDLFLQIKQREEEEAAARAAAAEKARQQSQSSGGSWWWPFSGGGAAAEPTTSAPGSAPTTGRRQRRGSEER